MKRWELWDTRSRNLLGVFDDSKAAFDAILLIENDEGTAIAESLALGVTNNGHPEIVAKGRELVDRAHKANQSVADHTTSRSGKAAPKPARTTRR